MCVTIVRQNKDLCYSRVCLLYPHWDQPETTALPERAVVRISTSHWISLFSTWESSPGCLSQLTQLHPAPQDRHSLKPDVLPDHSALKNEGVNLERSKMFVLSHRKQQRELFCNCSHTGLGGCQVLVVLLAVLQSSHVISVGRMVSAFKRGKGPTPRRWRCPRWGWCCWNPSSWKGDLCACLEKMLLGDGSWLPCRETGRTSLAQAMGVWFGGEVSAPSPSSVAAAWGWRRWGGDPLKLLEEQSYNYDGQNACTLGAGGCVIPSWAVYKCSAVFWEGLYRCGTWGKKKPLHLQPSWIWGEYCSTSAQDRLKCACFCATGRNRSTGRRLWRWD